MSHSHGAGSHHSAPVPPQVRRLLTFILIPCILATLVGMAVLWPGDLEGEGPEIGFPTDLLDATVVSVASVKCQSDDGGEQFDCTRVRARLTEGPNDGKTIVMESTEGADAVKLEKGDRVVLGRSPGSPPGLEYYFADYQRGWSLFILLVIFIAIVVALGRWRGVFAILGLGVSLLIVVKFVLPAILAGSSPIAVAIVGSAGIMFIALYLAHGVSVRTTTAVLGTLVALGLTGILASIFVRAGRLTGFTSEEAIFLQISAGQINLRGLILAGIIIGSLGVLDDVTVTQASAVWELRAANPTMSRVKLYRSALRIGRDHIASTVNTLVLAYAGASLPLLILFSLAGAKVGDVLNGEIVAEEIIRTLVGSIGLAASVPVTTWLAAALASQGLKRAKPAEATSDA